MKLRIADDGDPERRGDARCFEDEDDDDDEGDEGDEMRDEEDADESEADAEDAEEEEEEEEERLTAALAELERRGTAGAKRRVTRDPGPGRPDVLF